MFVTEAIAYVIGFFAIWGSALGAIWAIDNLLIARVFGRTIIDKDYWQ